MTRKRIGYLLGFSVVGVLVLLIAAQPIYTYLDSMSGYPSKMVCFKNVRHIGLAMLQYAGDHGDNFPVSLGVLLKERYLTTWKVFICPHGRREAPPGFPDDYPRADPAALNTVDQWGAYEIAPGVRHDMSADFIIVYEKPPGHGRDEANVWSLLFGAGEAERPCMFNDGHVEYVGEARFQALMKAQEAELRAVREKSVE